MRTRARRSRNASSSAPSRLTRMRSDEIRPMAFNLAGTASAKRGVRRIVTALAPDRPLIPKRRRLGIGLDRACDRGCFSVWVVAQKKQQAAAAVARLADDAQHTAEALDERLLRLRPEMVGGKN